MQKRRTTSTTAGKGRRRTGDSKAAAVSSATSPGGRKGHGSEASAAARTIVRADGSVSATDAKNRLGEVLKAARELGRVFIEKHGRHQAVVLDIAAYEALLEKRRTPDERHLEELRKEFDQLYERMQTEEAHAAIDRFLSLSDEEINRAVGPRD